MTAVITISGTILLFYLLTTFWLVYVVHQIPRRPVWDKPDWGKITDTKIPAVDGGFLEVWRIDPGGRSCGVVVFAHGWGRNRDRMVSRARIFGKLGFTAVIHSARDHGGSSPRRFMNAMKFAEDIEAVLNWVGEPVLLYGHSAGAAGATIAASRDNSRIKLLFLEGCYAYTKASLLNLYRWYNPVFGILFGPVVLFWMDMFYKGGLDTVSPARLAAEIKIPVLIVHGEKDRRFPIDFAKTLKKSFSAGNASLYIAKGAGHSESSKTAGYEPAVKTFLERHL
ncbi:alpha/beta hydrolase [Thermodesulfobacteriota bacterium]